MIVYMHIDKLKYSFNCSMFMERKIMKMGPSSLVISLPSEFVKKYNLKKGNDLNVIDAGDALVLRTDKETSLGACDISISKFNPIIMRVLGILYKVGYDEIGINYDAEEKVFNNEKYSELDLIQKCADVYPGVDIISLKKEKIILKENSKIIPSEFKNSLNQAFFNLTQLASEVLRSLKNSTFNSGKEIELMEKLLNQNTNFCLRMISKKTYSDFSKTPNLYFIIVNLEQIGDLFNSVYKVAVNSKIKLNKGFLELIDELLSLVLLFQSAYQKFEVEKVIDFAKKSLKLNKNLINIGIKGKIEEREILLMISNINARLYDLIEPFLAINHEKIITS